MEFDWFVNEIIGCGAGDAPEGPFQSCVVIFLRGRFLRD